MLKFDSSLKIVETLNNYDQTWQRLLKGKGLNSFRATTLSIKVASKVELYKMLQENTDNIEQVHIGTVNARYIASAVLKQPYHGLNILKILERRSGSTDPLGLDSLDYLIVDINQTFKQLKTAGLPIIKEYNDVHAWLSLRFGDHNEFEAKFTDHLILEVAIKELQMSIEKIL
jgi:hypothetical protein